MRRFTFGIAALVCTMFATTLAHARSTPLGTAFTYQGQLKLSGNPVNTTADFQFTLWDALSVGTQVAGPAAANNVAIVNGMFSLPIDFGAVIFNSQARWLEIAVRSPAGGGAFQTLSPRQPLTATPYALQTRGIFVDVNDNVGIGTIVAPNRLTVNGNGSFTGNVTIGTNTPLTKLMITDNENLNGTNFTGGVADAGLLISNNFTVNAFTPGLFWHTIDNQPNKPKAGIFLQETALGAAMHLGTSGDYTVGITNDAIVINPSGFVGIGTNSPEGTLHVFRGSAGSIAAYPLSSLVLEGSTHNYLSMLAPAGSENGILFGHPFDDPSAGGIVYNSAGTPGGIEFRSGGNATHMKIHSDGRVVIGVETHNEGRLHVESTAASGAAIVATSIANAMYGVSSGVGYSGVFGFSEASTGFGAGVKGRSNSATGYDFYADGNGIHYGTPSSIRWKRNIEPIGDPLDRVSQIRGVWYDWDQEHGGRHDVGMVAEEVGKVMPEIVAYEENGIDAAGMDYSKLTPLLVEAVKALRAEKDAQLGQQQRQLDSLQSENAELRKDLKTLENQVRLLAENQRGAK